MIGIEDLAALTAKLNKGLHRMLSVDGSASMDKLAVIFHAMRECMNVSFEAHSVAA